MHEKRPFLIHLFLIVQCREIRSQLMGVGRESEVTCFRLLKTNIRHHDNIIIGDTYEHITSKNGSNTFFQPCFWTVANFLAGPRTCFQLCNPSPENLSKVVPSTPKLRTSQFSGAYSPGKGKPVSHSFNPVGDTVYFLNLFLENDEGKQICISFLFQFKHFAKEILTNFISQNGQAWAFL